MWFKETKEDPFAGFEMTPNNLKKLCKELKLYSSCPELNEILHLHQKGIVKIKNLDEYVNLRTIYFECNAISKLEGLDHLVNLRCLYMNENLVEFITGLDTLKQLETLNLADNQIKTVQGLNNCTKLSQLNLSGNRIQSASDVYHLKECQNLQSLDLSKNRIDEEAALEVIRSLDLRLLRVVGNPVVSTTRHYRKITIVKIPHIPRREIQLSKPNVTSLMLILRTIRSFQLHHLQYMDDSPVFPKDRRLAEAWNVGGAKAETTMREAICKEEAETRERYRKEFNDMINKAKIDATLEQQIKKQQEQELVVQSMEETDVGDDMLHSDNNFMDEDQIPVLEKLTSDAKKRDVNAFHMKECPSPRRNWLGVEFIGSNIQIQEENSMNQSMDLGTTTKYIESPPNNASTRMTHTLLNNTTFEIHNTLKLNNNSGLVTLMDNSEGILDIATINKSSSEESYLELSILENVDTNSKTTLDSETYDILAHDPEAMTIFSTQELEWESQYVEKELTFKREHQERILRRAVMNANSILEKEKQTTSNDMNINLDNDGQQLTRPIIWGTEVYKKLWAKASEASNLIELDC